ncbi:MAG: NHLP bacteriocin export ABC transporter permease/ATPase subunit [Polyangiaceae bacterium]
MGISKEQIARLARHFEADARDVLVEGDDPLLLSDPSRVYVTRQPQLQLFCVGYEAGAAAGRREHVALAGEGQLLIGLAPEGTALLLSGMAGSHVLSLPKARFFEAAKQDELRPIVLSLVEELALLLSKALPQAAVPTRCHAIAAGRELLDATLPLRADQGIVWLSGEKPANRLGGLSLAGTAALPRHLPITENSWALWEGKVVTSSTEAIFTSDEGGAFLEDFARFSVEVLGRERLALEARRLERDQVSRRAEADFVSESLLQLARVGQAERLAPDLGRGEAFELACRKIASWLEIPMPSTELPKGTGLSHMQAALARLTGVRTRAVLLDEGWFRHDAGALLGFSVGEENELHPVALLPVRGGYVIDDPRQSAPEQMTDAVTERLHPQAYQFYAPLPDRPITPLDVMLFSTRRARRELVFTLGIGMALGSLTTLIPLLTGEVFDTLIPGAERGLLLQLMLVLFCVYVGHGLFDVARGLALVRAQTRMDVTLEAAIWDRLLALPLPFFREYSAGDLAARAAGIGQIRDVLAGNTLAALLSGLFSIWNLGFLYLVDPGLALAATGLVVVAAVPAAIATRYSLKRQREVATVDGKIEGLLLQLFSGIAKLRVTAAENRAFSVWARWFARRRDQDLGAEWVNVRMAVFQSVFPIFCSVVLYFLLAGGGKQKISTGQFLAFSTAFGVFLAATLHVIDAALHSLVVIPMYERAKPILSQRSETQGGGARPELEGAIEVNHVSFRYDAKGPSILEDVSLQIGADEFVALVGPSGSGKSTLLRLLLGFETPTEGGIYYDGRALGGLDVRVVRKQIGVVMQNSRVMAGDIFTNIVGSTGLGLDDAWRAARSAALDNDIESMPMGMHTVISQGGGTLSGGQRQRLLIARALAGQPKILFFDEATSALDNVTQAVVSQSLEGLRVTRVVIAHRLSTIRHADRIIVLEKGRVVQSGRFEELMAVDGPFRTLAKRQTI